MDKQFWGIVSIILLVSVFSLAVFGNWIKTVYDIITSLNLGFFSKMPAWFNFMISGVVISGLIAIARGFRK